MYISTFRTLKEVAGPTHEFKSECDKDAIRLLKSPFIYLQNCVPSNLSSSGFGCVYFKV